MGVLKYGQVKGPVVSQEFPVAASTIFGHDSGCFVQMNTSGHILMADATSTDIIGWAITGDFTASSTAGQTKVPVNLSHDAVYEMPIDTARTEAQLIALVGITCDIVVTSNVQYADYDATSVNILQIVGYNYYGSALGQQTVLVKLYVPNLTTQA